ncbi:copper homeostasis protein CutC [Thalassobellus citreus]|uniref:copper homeostasis protein CutC n=1 Tax=Thalassobellus citreus TaxID=3367752 RepID=UPI0037BE07B0
MLLEICASSYLSVINAEKAGADRVELCSELALGGITPSYGFIKKVKQNLSIPAFILIRPRSGNFYYSDNEFNIMKTNIELCKELGCNGIVSGVLNSDNTIDVERTQELVELSKPLPFTFHRAFDKVKDSFEALEQLINIGVDRILTSGKEASAEGGFKHLLALRKQATNKLIILPGSGINKENVLLFKNAKFEEMHCSASTIHYVNELEHIPLNSKVFFDERILVHSDYNKIKSIVDIVN